MATDFNAWLEEKITTSAHLSKWKDKGQIDIWIHTNSGMDCRLNHVLPFVRTGKNKDGDDEEMVGFFNFVCHEDVRDFHFRKNPPQHCPIDLIVEQIRNENRIADDDIVYRVEIGDRKRDRFISKVDFIGEGKSKDSWQNTMKPQCQYVLVVIDHANPANGLVVATEKFSLGEKIKKAIKKEVERRGDLGNPHINPYPFRWKFDENARNFSDYYDAYPLDLPITEQIQSLLDADPLDLGMYMNPGDTSKLRSILEAHLTDEVKQYLDLDEAFSNTLENAGSSDPENLEEEESPPPPKATKPVSRPAAAQTTTPPTTEKKVEAPKEEPKPEPKKAAPKAKKVEPPKEPDPPPPPPPKEEPKPKTVKCPLCDGTGTYKKKKCVACGGTGVEEEEETTEEPTETVQVAECGQCKKDIPVDADVCPFCNARFS